MHSCSLAVLVLLVGCVAAGGELFYHLTREKRPCTSGSDCGRGECCLSPVQRRGKRQTDGFCSPLTASGANCYVNNNGNGPVYYDGCPCRNGFTCVGSGNFVVPQGELGTCEPEARSCTTAKDCRKGECCVNQNRPRGKKKRSLFGGTCQSLGTEGDNCLENQSTVQNQNFVCPCAFGFTCQITSLDVPLGPAGFCTAK